MAVTRILESKRFRYQMGEADLAVAHQLIWEAAPQQMITLMQKGVGW
jgi:hypothetical protein